MSNTMLPKNGMNPRKNIGPAKFASCSRRQVIESDGSTSPAQKIKNMKPMSDSKPLAAPYEIPLEYCTALSIMPTRIRKRIQATPIMSATHQYSLRDARPENEA